MNQLMINQTTLPHKIYPKPGEDPVWDSIQADCAELAKFMIACSICDELSLQITKETWGKEV